MNNEDYDEYEDDLEDEYSSDDDDNKSFYTNNSDSDEINTDDEDDEELKKKNDSINEEEDEDEEDEEDDEEDDEEEIENNEKINYREKIKKYKKENIEMFSKLGMISYLCNNVDYVKNGGFMIDNRNDLEYPNDTEESYVFESILTNTSPFVYIVNNHKINVSHENQIICLKMVLRCVDENKTIFFTKNFKERFPYFKKNLFNNYISKEEKEEIKNNKKIYNIV